MWLPPGGTVDDGLRKTPRLDRVLDARDCKDCRPSVSILADEIRRRVWTRHLVLDRLGEAPASNPDPNLPRQLGELYEKRVSFFEPVPLDSWSS